MPSLPEHLRTRLRRRLQRLERDLGQRAEAMQRQGLDRPESESVGELSSYDQHTSDLADETYERSKDLGLLERLRITRDEVHQALVRMDRGTYGYCEECGRSIGTARLLAMPYARRCVHCQRIHDRDEQRRVEAGPGLRPLEEATLAPPFARANLVNEGEAALGPEDVWEALAPYGNANSPQDVPGAVDYDETFEGADTQLQGGTGEVEFVADVTGQGVADLQAIYPDPSGPGRRRPRSMEDEEEQPPATAPS
ncbi:MAG: TraR/DksA C4-type zinc finger protein [Limnochordaceae bacterium]|nr:TraR/DksA C4-type zinc finger protein [Limnochordaceae bacterium]